MKLEEAIRKFTSYKSSYTTRAYKEYKRSLDRFFEFTQKDTEQLDLEDVAEFKVVLKKKYNLSDYSISQSLTAIKQMIAFFYRRGKCHIDPEDIRIPKNFTINSHPPVEKEDYERLLKNSDPNTFEQLQHLCAMRFFWETGVRVGELCDIRVAQLKNTPGAVIRTEKNGLQRRILWSKETHLLLKKMVSIREQFKDSSYLFCSLNPHSKDKLGSRAIQRWVSVACKRAGIKKNISPHWFRNAWAVQRRDKGAPLPFIQKGLGHKSITSTAIYTRYDDAAFDKEAKKHLR